MTIYRVERTEWFNIYADSLEDAKVIWEESGDMDDSVQFAGSEDSEVKPLEP